MSSYSPGWLTPEKPFNEEINDRKESARCVVICFVFVYFFLKFLLVAHTKVKSVKEESWLVSMNEIQR